MRSLTLIWILHLVAGSTTHDNGGPGLLIQRAVILLNGPLANRILVEVHLLKLLSADFYNLQLLTGRRIYLEVLAQCAFGSGL
jgi:hypothetical protein